MDAVQPHPCSQREESAKALRYNPEKHDLSGTVCWRQKPWGDEMIGRRAFCSSIGAAALTFPCGRRSSAQTNRKVLRVVPQAEPQSFDPVFTQVNNVSMHGAMIYDQLFGWDDKMNAQPQMVDDWKVQTTDCCTPLRCAAGLSFMTVPMSPPVM